MRSLLFFFFLIAKWIMDPTVCTQGRAASWRMGWPIMSIRGRRTDGGSLLLYAALIKLEDNYRIGQKKIKRWSISRQNSQLYFLLSICFTIILLFPPPCSAACPLRLAAVCLSEWVAEFQCHSWCQLGPWLLFYSQPGLPSLSLLTVPG